MKNIDYRNLKFKKGLTREIRAQVAAAANEAANNFWKCDHGTTCTPVLGMQEQSWLTTDYSPQGHIVVKAWVDGNLVELGRTKSARFGNELVLI